ncbi:MAG: flagellar hook-basal body complex protein, partial [Eubacteriales bacterium]|nr:flagellar hook-basal body complex protein [Eubacteriales bacterium]
MLGSMYSAVSGLSAHQTKMNVIGNNIANVNTYGFKSSRVAFTDVFYQTLNGASAPTKEKGGINANQLGYGAKVGSIDVIHTRSGSADTGRALDVYINGDGYLPVKGGDGTVKYTRVGNLKFDPAGNLTDFNGNLVLGLPKNQETDLPQLGEDGAVVVQSLTPIALEANVTYTGIAIGAGGEITGIKAGDPMFTPGPGTGWIKSSNVVPDSQYRAPVRITTERSDEVAFVSLADKDGKALYTGTVDADANIDGNIRVYCDATDPANPKYKLKYKDKDGADQPHAVATVTSGDSE